MKVQEWLYFPVTTGALSGLLCHIVCVLATSPVLGSSVYKERETLVDNVYLSV